MGSNRTDDQILLRGKKLAPINTAAMISIGESLCSSLQRAASDRARSVNRAGVSPV